VSCSWSSEVKKYLSLAPYEDKTIPGSAKDIHSSWWQVMYAIPGHQ